MAFSDYMNFMKKKIAMIFFFVWRNYIKLITKEIKRKGQTNLTFPGGDFRTICVHILV